MATSGLSLSPVGSDSQTGSRTSALGSATSKIKSDDFLKLLLTQLRYQNPLEPVSNAEFMGQLAQFSTVDGIQQLNVSFNDLLKVQGLSQGASLIGKRIIYDKPGSTTPERGTVDSVQIINGNLSLLVGTTPVTLELVRGIEAPPDSN